MTTQTLEQEIVALVRTLNEDQKLKVLEFAREIKRPQGISGEDAIRIAREINFDSESLAEMQKAIEEAFEQGDYPYPEVDFDE